VVRIEIASDHNAFNGRHRSADHVVGVRQELGNGDLTFLNVLRGLRFSIPVSNQIAFKMYRMDA
jgi:hypothetical protein